LPKVLIVESREAVWLIGALQTLTRAVQQKQQHKVGWQETLLAINLVGDLFDSGSK
jgi:hypothetical protein